MKSSSKTDPDAGIYPTDDGGMTKREHFALELLQSRVIAKGPDAPIGFKDATDAVTMADALIAALNDPRGESAEGP